MSQESNCITVIIMAQVQKINALKLGGVSLKSLVFGNGG
jgi:hypothetical protein